MLDQLEELLDPRLQHLVVRGHVLSIKTDILLILAQMAHWSTYHLIEPQAMIASTVVAIEVAFLRLWETILLSPHLGHLRPRDLLFPQRGTMSGRRGCQSHMLAKVCHRNMYKNNSLYFQSQFIQTLRHKSYFFQYFFQQTKISNHTRLMVRALTMLAQHLIKQKPVREAMFLFHQNLILSMLKAHRFNHLMVRFPIYASDEVHKYIILN